ncbi:MAG: hypothetical protein ACREND_15510 [Gemmatimonadaceae bacterium]
MPELSVPLGTVSAVEPLVIHQQALSDIEAHASSSPSFAFGILYGAIYRCPRLHMDYALIEGIERGDAADTSDLRAPLEEMIARLHAGGLQPLGWYRSAAEGGMQMSSTDTAMHATLFPEPWAVALLQDASTPRLHGATVRLTARLRPYAVPFYELQPARYNGEGELVRSVIDWPTYRTTADVIRPEASPSVAFPQIAPPEQAPQFQNIESIFDAPPAQPAGAPAAHTPRRPRFEMFSYAPRVTWLALAALAIAVAIGAAWYITH